MAKTATMTIPDVMTIAQAQQTYDKLSKLLDNDSADTLVLKGDKVSRVDTAGIQLLTVFLRTAAKFAKTVELNKPSQVLLDGFRTLGLEEQLPEIKA